MDDSTRDKRSQQIVASMLAKQLTWDREKKEMEERMKELEKQKRDAKVKALQYRAQTKQWQKGMRTVDNPTGSLPKISFGKVYDQAKEEREKRRAEKRRLDEVISQAKKMRQGDVELPSLKPRRLGTVQQVTVTSSAPSSTTVAPEVTRTVISREMKERFRREAEEQRQLGPLGIPRQYHSPRRTESPPVASILTPPGQRRQPVVTAKHVGFGDQEIYNVEIKPEMPAVKIEPPALAKDDSSSSGLEDSEQARKRRRRRRRRKGTTTVSNPVIIELSDDDVTPRQEPPATTGAIDLRVQSQATAPETAALGSEADPVVGLSAEVLARLPPEFNRPPPSSRVKGVIPVVEAFRARMRERPMEHDDRPLLEDPVPVPKAALTKPRAKDRRPRRCWICLPRAWLAKEGNFTKPLFGHGSIRYRGTTFASLCHHPTTPWDCHALCWQCYKDLDLPLCGLDPLLKCASCDQMGSEAHRARNEKLTTGVSRNFSVKTGLPVNVYTQQDADEVMWDKDIVLTPNPDWLSPGEPVGNCFPERLIRPGQSVADAVRCHPEWSQDDYYKLVNEYNASDRAQKLKTRTTSERQRRTIPRCLSWGHTPIVEEVLPLPHNFLEQDVDKAMEATVPVADQPLTTFMKTQTEVMGAMIDKIKQLGVLQPTAKPEHVTAQDWEQIVAGFSEADIQTAARSAAEAAEIELPDDWSTTDLSGVSHELLQTLVRSQGRRIDRFLKEQQEVTSRIKQEPTEQDSGAVQSESGTTGNEGGQEGWMMTPEEHQRFQSTPLFDEATKEAVRAIVRRSSRSSRSSSEDPEAKRKKQKSPFELEREHVPPISQRYDEMEVKISDWTARGQQMLFGGPIEEAPNGKLTKLLCRLRELNVGIKWNMYKGKSMHDDDVTIYVPTIDAECLTRYWQLSDEMRRSNPFDVRFDFPADIGQLHGLEPHFSLHGTFTVADVSGKFPKSRDYLPMSIAENEQLIRLTNATASLNNIILVTTKVLAWRLEDLSRELAPDRYVERTLCGINRQAAQLLNETNTRANLIAKAVMRRDAMLRTNRDPHGHQTTFVSPMPTKKPFFTTPGNTNSNTLTWFCLLT